jgi:hypothetical protein
VRGKRRIAPFVPFEPLDYALSGSVQGLISSCQRAELPSFTVWTPLPAWLRRDELIVPIKSARAARSGCVMFSTDKTRSAISRAVRGSVAVLSASTARR